MREWLIDCVTHKNLDSTGIDLFINEAMSEVREVSETLSVMKTNLHRLESLMEGWSAQPLMSRFNKASTITDFEQLQRQVRATRGHIIKTGGVEVHKLLKDTIRKLKVDSKQSVRLVCTSLIGRLGFPRAPRLEGVCRFHQQHRMFHRLNQCLPTPASIGRGRIGASRHCFSRVLGATNRPCLYRQAQPLTPYRNRSRLDRRPSDLHS